MGHYTKEDDVLLLTARILHFDSDIKIATINSNEIDNYVLMQ